MFFFRNRKENVVEKLVPEIFLKTQNQRYLWISSLKFCKACFFYMSKSRTTKIY